MRLLVDAQALQSPSSRHRGIGRYAGRLVATMAALRPGWQIELVQSAHFDPADADICPGLPRRTFTPPFAGVVGHNDANERYYADWLTAQEPDAILACSFFENLAVVPWFTGSRPPLFGILYDLIPLLFAGGYMDLRTTLTHYGHRFRQMLQCDTLLAISRATAEDLRRLLPGRSPAVMPVGGAADPSFAPHAEAALPVYRERFRRQWGLARDFVLYVGGFDFRKNLLGALRAFAALPDADRARLDFVIACRLAPEERAVLEQAAAGLGIAGSLKLTGFVSDEDLRALYQLCRVFFFPSLYEGLGLPVLEALQCGAPVVAARHSSIPEFAGSVCALADSCATEDLTRALQAALAEPRDAEAAARQAHAAGFRWERVAELACQTLERPSRPAAAPRRRRIAWVTPLPPSPSPVAGLAADLLGPLAEHFEIDVVPEAAGAAPEAVSRDHLVLSPAELVKRHGADPYDLFVYHVADSPCHAYLLDLLARFPGLVVLHDVTLGRLARAVGADEVPGPSALLHHVLGRAETVVVGAAESWQAVRALTDVPVARVPPAVVPAYPAPAWRERCRLGLPAEAFVICTLVTSDGGARVEAILRAVTDLPAGIRERSLLVIVGEELPGERERLLGLARALGIGRNVVRWVEHVPPGDRSAYPRAADVCVQLGGSAASVYRALAAGAACVLSGQGPADEMPAGVALVLGSTAREVEGLREALVQLHEHPERRVALARAGLRHACEDRGVGATARRYVALIEMAAAVRATGERTWSDLATDALAACPTAPPPEAPEDWARLRRRGQDWLQAAPAHAGSGAGPIRRPA
jgi:glycosyltransferase involved in cell wall biosynthesis